MQKRCYEDNLTLSRCDGRVTNSKCSGLAIITKYPFVKPKFTKWKCSKCPDVKAGSTYQKSHIENGQVKVLRTFSNMLIFEIFSLACPELDISIILLDSLPARCRTNALLQ